MDLSNSGSSNEGRTAASAGAPEPSRAAGPVIYRQSLWTRLTHWLWAISLFFLLLSGLQIFNAHPVLYFGDQSGFGFDNAVLAIGAENTETGAVGHTTVFGHRFDTSGLLGLSWEDGQAVARGFPSWATIPSYHDLATGRVVHFFFAWMLSATLLLWLLGSLVNGHLGRDLAPRLSDLRNLPRDVADHVRLRFHHTRQYNTLQKFAYGGVLFALFPLMIATGLAMSPTMNAALPWLPEVFGGRQTARTIHFLAMLLLVGFFVIHMLMILAAGPINELRSIVTGWYRTDPPTHAGMQPEVRSRS
ncbi:cytochrome b/b6 domain-containing protein [Mesorhizobium sp. LHD-90]|uniref:cytochrome b/b6 domain-containing protein n=1 Tax=Mesorhizobium sp. LHD-90 TaxID=3071414 RepID=UPI0027E10B05|nr:cytochrome b/b6 domain-containing protein [Mesorhizobium sp. LHD-90]MDQ6438310.1 cytochrome b/b6 domain-containing protein [Mesorhizobium sp. LHD-90]